MPQTLDNGIILPINSDAYNLSTDLATAGNSTNTVTVVTSQAAQDALTKYTGRVCIRTDLGGVQYYWNGTAWQLLTNRQLGSVSNAGNNVVGISVNNMLETTVVVGAARLIEIRASIDGGGTSGNSPNNMYVGYTISYGGTGTGGTAVRTFTKAYTISGNGEGVEISARYTTAAGGSLRFNLQGQVVIPSTGAQTMTATTGNSRLTITDIGPA